ncbi:hypothetical protein A7A08_03029 [Methyloligella halotolerans]|uniref:Carbonic anhydrase n=1 Tax=Methyloligella halotolerans TaxID=1177755 RepID=A0A1E2RV53_9HYPH|nr:hypothetical protein A7A08_03029 [Methyloligella halotolerans]
MTLLEGVELDKSDVETYGEEMALELAGVRSSLKKLRSFPALKEREAQGLVSLHGLHLDIGDNKLVQLDTANGCFVPIVEDVASVPG